MTLKQLTEEIIKEFDGFQNILKSPDSDKTYTFGQIKSFFEHSLSHVAHETIEAVKVKKIESEEYYDPQDPAGAYESGYNQSLQEIEDKSKHFLEA